MEKIPTAKEFLIEAGFPGHAKHGLAKKWMIEFAKLHVEACKKEIADKAIEYHDSILACYPLENIK